MPVTYTFNTIPGYVGTTVNLIMILEDGDETQHPQAEINVTGGTHPLAVIDLVHKAKGRYEGQWIPTVAGTYSAHYFVYTDVSHLHENAHYYREIEVIEVMNNSVDDLAAKIARILGLVHENAFIDNTVFDAFSQLIQCRVRIFDSQAHAALATDGGSETDGLVAVYEMHATYETLGRLGTYRYLRVS